MLVTLAVADGQDLTRFVRPKDFDPKQIFRASLGVMTGPGDYCVVIEMDAWLTDIIRCRRLHSSQQLTEMPGGGAQLRLRLVVWRRWKDTVLSWGPHAIL